MSEFKAKQPVAKVKKPVTRKAPVKKVEVVPDHKVECVTKNGIVTIGGQFKCQVGMFKIIERNIRQKVNTLFLGPTGVN